MCVCERVCENKIKRKKKERGVTTGVKLKAFLYMWQSHDYCYLLLLLLLLFSKNLSFAIINHHIGSNVTLNFFKAENGLSGVYEKKIPSTHFWANPKKYSEIR